MPVYTEECELGQLRWEQGNRIRERLHRGEQVLGCWKTSYRGGRESGLIVAYVITSMQLIVAPIWPHRSLFYDPRYHSSVNSMPLRDVMQVVEDEPRYRVSRLVVRGARGNRLAMEFGSGPSFEHFKQMLEAARTGTRPQPLTAPPVLPNNPPDVAQPDIANQLARLGELYKQGILTDEEYRLAKNRVLER